ARLLLGFGGDPTSQDGAQCRFDLDRSSAETGVTGGSVGVGLATMSGCNWTATSKAGWIAVAQGTTGNGPAQVVWSVAPNTAGARSWAGCDRRPGLHVNKQGVSPPPETTPAPAPTPAPPPTRRPHRLRRHRPTP